MSSDLRSAPRRAQPAKSDSSIHHPRRPGCQQRWAPSAWGGLALDPWVGSGRFATDGPSQVLVSNALMPAKVSEIALCFELGRATVIVDEDQLSLAIGKHGQNVRLAARLTGWDIDILTPDEYNQGIERLTSCIKTVEEADDSVVDKLIALGVISVPDLEDVGKEPLINELKVDSDLAEKLVEAASMEAKRLADESKKNEAEKQLARQTKAGDDE